MDPAENLEKCEACGKVAMKEVVIDMADCVKCGKSFDANDIMGVCPECGNDDLKIVKDHRYRECEACGECRPTNIDGGCQCGCQNGQPGNVDQKPQGPSKEDLAVIYARLGESKVLGDTMDVVKANSVYEHELGLLTDKGFIPRPLPIPEGEKHVMRMRIICKATDKFLVTDIIIQSENIEWAKDSLAFKIARAILRDNPIGLKLE